MTVFETCMQLEHTQDAHIPGKLMGPTAEKEFAE
jgi:hypothetical protein